MPGGDWLVVGALGRGKRRASHPGSVLLTLCQFCSWKRSLSMFIRGLARRLNGGGGFYFFFRLFSFWSRFAGTRKRKRIVPLAGGCV